MNILPTDLPYEDYIGLQESQYVQPAGDFIQDVKDRFTKGNQIEGETLPWHKTHDIVRLREGEVSLWVGYNGHKKSMLVGQVALWLPVDQRIVIASLEMAPHVTLVRMVKQALGNNSPTDSFIDDFFDQTQNMFLYNQQDTIPPERILGMVDYMAKEYDINHFFIDSLVKCGLPTDDYSKQKEFIDKLAYLARKNSIHIHLVHHARKGKDENTQINKMDVKGAGELTDLVDNLFLCQTNKKKKEKIDAGGNPDPIEPDQTITVAKQRHGEWEGRIALWFREKGLQFVGEPKSMALKWRA